MLFFLTESTKDNPWKIDVHLSLYIGKSPFIFLLFWFFRSLFLGIGCFNLYSIFSSYMQWCKRNFSLWFRFRVVTFGQFCIPMWYYMKYIISFFFFFCDMSLMFGGGCNWFCYVFCFLFLLFLVFCFALFCFFVFCHYQFSWVVVSCEGVFNAIHILLVCVWVTEYLFRSVL